MQRRKAKLGNSLNIASFQAIIKPYKLIIMTLNLRKLISVSTQLSVEACRIISQTWTHHNFKSYEKGPGDLVTDTDFMVQQMIVHGIKLHFPNIGIIGQETAQFKGKIQYNYGQLNTDILPSQSVIDQQIDAQHVCLWIDPLDCTLGYVKGNVQDVTVLIGVSAYQRPIAGIIGTPFKVVDGNKVADPVVTVGSTKEKEAYDFIDGKWHRKQSKYPINTPLRIVTSNSRQTTPMTADLLRTLKAINVKAGGSGRKIMMVANGEVDAMTYCQNWTHKWDSCAGDAIIKAMRGRFTTSWGNNIRYRADRSSTHNKQGMLVTLNHGVYEKCSDILNGF